MIQIYDPENENFNMNGDATLTPISCEAGFIINDVWNVEMTHPINDVSFHIVENAVLSVPTMYGKRQLYRIYDVDKNHENIQITAYPIFLDAKNDCFLFDVRPTDKNGQEALDIMMTNRKYKASSNIQKISTSYFQLKNLIEAINGEDDNTFLKRWGGEIIYKNHEIIINDRIGNDNGLRVEAGFNMTGIKETVDMNDVVTSIVPKSFNGYTLPNNETVDSPLINKYPVKCIRVIEYEDIKLKDDADEDDEENGVVVCKNKEELYKTLRNRAKQEYEDNEIDKPKITYEVNMIDLSSTDKYKDFKDLLKVYLGDDVYIKNKRLDIQTKARVIEIKYDCILQKVTELVLGDYTQNYFDNVTSAMDSIEKIEQDNGPIVGGRIYGTINALNAQFKYQLDKANKSDFKAILFEDIDETSSTYGAMALGTQGFQIANKRNTENTDWDWRTFGTADGFYADQIIAGILQGVKIICDSGNIGGFSVGANGLKYTRSNLDVGATKGTMTFSMPTSGHTDNAVIFEWALSPTTVGAADTIKGKLWADTLEMMYGLFDTVTAYDFTNRSKQEDKENILKFIDSALNEIMKTDVCSYNFKNKEQKKYGFVLGEDFNVSDKIVTYQNNQKIGIDLYSAIALAYKAIQELKNELEVLKNDKNIKK